MRRYVSLRFLAAFALSSMSIGASSADDPATIEPEAARILQRMSDYLGSLEQFSFSAEATIDEVLLSGQQLQRGARVDIAVSRPNRIRVDRKADIVVQELYFDGSTLTLYGNDVNYYANMALSKPVDINTALDVAREEVGIILPGADLVYQDAYQVLMEDVESGMLVGSSTIDGVKVHHLAFRGSEVDWQIWIEKGDRPLPRKYLITSKWIAGAPQFTVLLSEWDTSARLEKTMFQFSPPPEAQNIGFIPLRADSSGSR